MKDVRHFVVGVAAVGAGLIALASAPAPARAATVWYVAPGGSDANSCASPAAPCATINGAIAKAGGGDTVDVATGIYGSAGNEVVLIDRDLTLEGGWDAGFTAQTGASTVYGGNLRLGVRVDSAAAALDRFVIENANETPSYSDAGGVYVDGPGSSLDLSTSTVRDNKWGAIWSSGPVSITDSTIEGNTGRFGNGGGVTVANGAPLTIVNSTISGNTAEFGGGILAGQDSPVDLSNVTIVGNTAKRETTPLSSPAGFGGGVWLDGGSSVFIRNSIVSGNSADHLDPNLPGPVFSDGYNIETGYWPAATDIVSSDPGVEALADNGGPTETRALRFDSPALDGGNPAGCTDAFGDPIVTDQRGVDRPLRYACDIGAFEAVPPANDDFADAAHLGAPVTGSNEFASKEPGEPDHAADPGGASVWYSLTPSFDGTAFVSTAGSSFDTLLGVYTGSSVSSLTTLAGNDDATQTVLTSKTCFSAVHGTLYHVAVDGFGAASADPGSEGSFSLSYGMYIDPHPCAMLPPSITGTPQVGRTLTASPGTWAGPSSGLTYQWFFCDDLGCSHIPGATAATYTPTSDAEGTQLYVQVTARDPDPSFDVPSTSALTAPVLAAPAPPPPPPPQAPKNAAIPTIAGTPKPGQTLTATPGTWNGTAPIAYAYQWSSCDPAGDFCATLPGETTSTYLVFSSDAGSTLRVVVTASNAAGNASATSAQTAVVQRPPARCLAPRLRGKTVARARTVLLRAHCALGRVSHTHSKLRRGRIVSQRPRAGVSRPRGTKVSVVVSRGPRR